MKHKYNTSGIAVIVYTINLLCFFAFATCINAQDCKRMLDEINRRPEFPTAKVNEYISCLNSTDGEYKRLVGIEPRNKAIISDIKANLLEKNKTDLNQARAANDSLRIDKFAKKEAGLKAKLDSLTLEIAISKEQSLVLKNVLKESYNKIITYFTEIEDSRKNEFQRKLETLPVEN